MIVSSFSPVNHAAPLGSEAAPDFSLPQALEVTGPEAMRALNPLQHVPVVGMIYRATTGDTIPTTLRVAGAGLVGGPLGMIGAGFMSLLEALINMGSDTSRPAVPVGMAQTGSEAGVEPVTPGTLTDGAYVTLATTAPDFLEPMPSTAAAQNGAAAYQNAALEWQRAQSVERGLA